MYLLPQYEVESPYSFIEAFKRRLWDRLRGIIAFKGF